MISKPQIIIEHNPPRMTTTGANIFTATAKKCATQKKYFSVAISGGSTPKSMHRMLADEPYRSEVPWNKTHIFWVDERCVPENNPASNYGAAKEDFLNRVPIPKSQIYPMPGEASPEDGATKYEKALRNFFQLEDGKFPIFDLIFLGIGTDGHTASLLPGQRALNEKGRLVVAVKGGDPYVNRLTMTFPVLNHARHIVFLVSGKEKATVLKTMFENSEAGLPAQMIQPIEGNLTWLLDREAASLLSGDIVRTTS